MDVIDLHPDLDLSTSQAERLLAAWLSGPVACTGMRRLKGGLVNTVFELEFDRPPHRAVVKLHGSAGRGLAFEARALRHLRAETATPVPEVYLQDSSAQIIPHAFLLIECVPGVCLETVAVKPADRADIDTQLADVLGELHLHTGTEWGPVGEGEWSSSWADVFVERLLEVRSYPAVAERLSSQVLEEVDEAIDMARPALIDSGTPTLVHGDVWDGNIMVAHNNGCWRLTGLLDPNLQFADVELELAYLEVFDTSREAFFAAYSHHHRLRPGYRRRRLFYWLHTALLHVALFGDEFFCSYTARTAESIRQGSSCR